jgi:hypothetical protein
VTRTCQALRDGALGSRFPGRHFSVSRAALPNPTLRKDVRKRLPIAFAAMDKRGATVRIGEGHQAPRAQPIANHREAG